MQVKKGNNLVSYLLFPLHLHQTHDLDPYLGQHVFLEFLPIFAGAPQVPLEAATSLHIL